MSGSGWSLFSVLSVFAFLGLEHLCGILGSFPGNCLLFDTPVYLLFLTIIVLCYWQLNHRRQNILLLVASYFFYGWWDWRFLSLILISTVVDFFCARYIDQSQDVRRRRLLLSISVVLNISFLGFFKYFDFFVDSLAATLTA